VVYAVGTLCGEPGLDVNDVWMRLLYSAIVFETFHYLHLRGLAWATVGAENFQGVKRDLVGAFALPLDEPDSRRGAEAKLVKDRVDARIGLEPVADVDWGIATRSIAFYIFDIVEARLTIDPDGRSRGVWLTHGGKDSGDGVDADEEVLEARLMFGKRGIIGGYWCTSYNLEEVGYRCLGRNS
jgi:hypothetical protein